MKIWIIDDNEMCRDSIRENIEDLYPDAIIKEFESIRGELTRELVGPDYAIIDISAVCPLNQVYMMGNFIWPFAKKFPGAELIIASGLAHIARDSIEECFSENDCGNVVHFVGMSSDLIREMESIIPKNKEAT